MKVIRKKWFFEGTTLLWPIYISIGRKTFIPDLGMFRPEVVVAPVSAPFCVGIGLRVYFIFCLPKNRFTPDHVFFLCFLFFFLIFTRRTLTLLALLILYLRTFAFTLHLHYTANAHTIYTSKQDKHLHYLQY